MLNGDDKIVIQPFRPEDQAAARALILAGLEEHWGYLDPAKNPGLDDIAFADNGEVWGGGASQAV